MRSWGPLCAIHHDHHLMLQHDNARPHVARICTQFLEAENIPVLAWPVYSPDTSPMEHVWEALDRRIRQRVPVPANIQQLHAIEEEWTNIHRPQTTTWSTLCEGDVLHCVRQMVVTPDTDWFSDPPNTVKLHILEWSFIVSSLRHTCAISCCLISILIWHTCEVDDISFTNTDLDRFVNKFDRNGLLCTEKVLDLWIPHEKWGQKQKCCVYNFVQCIYAKMHSFILMNILKVFYWGICSYICLMIFILFLKT